MSRSQVTTRATQERSRPSVGELLSDRAHVVVIVLFMVSLGSAYHSAQSAIESALIFSAKKNTASMADSLAAFRTLYTREVVEKVRGKVEVSHLAFERGDAIPLPATLTIALGEEISAGRSGVTASLYSPYPFPWRVRDEDTFKSAAWAYLVDHPDEEYSRIETIEGEQVLRYATADVMRAACVECHNSHADSPKKDWVVGEVRGILEVSEPIASIVSEGRREIRLVNVSLALAALLGLLAVGLVSVTYRQRAVEQRRLQEDLRIRNDELEQFAYRSSHDLKAPLTTIKGLASYVVDDLEDGQLDEASTNATRIVEQAARLEKLVVDILDLARADLKEEEMEEIVIETLLTDMRDKFSHSLQDKEVVLAWEVNFDSPIVTQRVRLVQVLENLVTNGIKYSDPSKGARKVHVKVDRVANNYRFVVQDNGLGIPEERQDQLYDSFTRFHPRVAEGSGLGMSIVKKHISAMRGTIKFESSEQGTTFSIDIPTRKEDKT